MEATEILRPGGSLSATELGGHGRQARFTEGRVCAFDDCPTVLSSYNPADRCWVHTEPKPKIALGSRPREEEGPHVLSGPEEQGLIRSILARRKDRVHPGRHPEPPAEPPPPPPAPPQPVR